MFWPAGGFRGSGDLENTLSACVFWLGVGAVRPKFNLRGSGGPGFAYPMTLEDLFSVLGTVGPARGGLASTGNLLHGSLERLDTLLIPR